MPLKGRTLKRRSIYRKATEKADLSIAISNFFERNSMITNSVNVASNPTLNSVALTSTIDCNDTYNAKYNSSISENEFSDRSDAEIFDEVVSNNLSLNSEENSFDRNSNINNNIYTY